MIKITMPKKTVTKSKAESKAETKPVETEELVAEVAVAAPALVKKGRGRKAATVVESTVPESTVPESTVPESTLPESTVTDSNLSESKKSRHVPTKDSVEKEFNDLIESLDAEIQRLRESSTKSKGVKFLRTINKNLKTLRNHALRVSKQKSTTRRVNSNSGFNKQVNVSKELSKFMGTEASSTLSRKEVTKFLCSYIRQNNLQFPTDKRIIMVDKDPKLKALLKYDGKDDKPLTYPRLQTYLKSHYLPTPSATSSVASTPAKKTK
jgi:chromatin remodeling complex protein RSC6